MEGEELLGTVSGNIVRSSVFTTHDPHPIYDCVYREGGCVAITVTGDSFIGSFEGSIEVLQGTQCVEIAEGNRVWKGH